MRSLSTFLLALILSASCGAPGADAIEAPQGGVLTTDATSYEARSLSSVQGRWAFNVVVRYTNPTAQPIYLARCYPNSPQPIYGVQLTDGSNAEGAAYSLAWACVGHDKQILVAPGATRVDTLTLGGPNASDGVTGRFYGALTGRFRIFYDPQGCTGDGACRIMTDSLRYSNEFRVRLMQ